MKKKGLHEIALEQQDELDRLRRCCVQRGARLKIMRDMMREVDWLHMVSDRPEMADWFDNDGVAK